MQTVNRSNSKKRSGAVETVPCQSTTLGHTSAWPPTVEKSKRQFMWEPSLLGGNRFEVSKYQIMSYIASVILVPFSGGYITDDGDVEIL